jgi:hypothetical protein
MQERKRVLLSPRFESLRGSFLTFTPRAGLLCRPARMGRACGENQRAMWNIRVTDELAVRGIPDALYTIDSSSSPPERRS